MTVHSFTKHSFLLLLLLLHFVLALAYASLTPLGEAPDEPAHLSYARFIAQQGHLPQTLAERTAAGYRSTWPPLYHLLLTAPLAAVGDAPPARLKAVGDSPRRLIPTNGQTIAAFIHTDDEAWPWRGLPLAWHLGRAISALLSTLALVPTYLIAWRVTRRRSLALSATALQATIPQVLFVGSVLNDDNLLILLAGIILLVLVLYTQAATAPGPGRLFLLGLLLGLAVVTKYNALPLWALAFVWVAWLRYRTPLPTTRTGSAAHIFSGLAVLLIGALISAGWWFGFIWRHFNQIDGQGLWAGSLAAVSAGAADATLRQINAGLSITWPTLAQWLEWLVTFFKSFWGLFGGGSTIELPAWSYWLLLLFCLLAAIPYIKTLIVRSLSPFTPSAPRSFLQPREASFIPLLLTPFFFLPLPLLRFLLSGSIVETAQGRHLFPALPAITLALIWGLHHFTQIAPRSPLSAPRPPLSAPRSSLILPTALILLTTLLSLISLPLIRASYPPPIPLRTTVNAAIVDHPLQARLTDSISLVGYELGQIANGIVPLTLVWQADATPPDDYLIELTLTGPTGQPIGGWLGHPLGGRYPTRAWDKGDILRHTIPLSLIPGQPATTATLTLTLLEPTSLQSQPPNQPTNQPPFGRTSPLTLTTNLPLPPAACAPLPCSPAELRADNLPHNAPFTYRSTLSLALPDSTPPELVAPDGRRFAPTQVITGPTGSLAHFIVAANWPSGNYQLAMSNEQLSIPIANRSRRFEPPPMQHRLDANFADRLTLLGYDLPNRRVRPGESFPLTLHLRAERTMGENLVIFNHLLDQAAVQRGGSDRIPQQYYTTLLWVPGEIVSDAYAVPVDPDAPPGVYWLDVGFYPSNQPNFSLPLFVDGQPIDRNSVQVGPLKVGDPPPGLTLPSVQPQHPLNQTFGDAITLLGFNLVDAAGKPIQNSKLKTQNSALTLYWQPTTPRTLPADYTVFIHLLDSAGKLIAQADSPPANGAYPTSLWDPGEIIVDAHALPDLPPGRYTLQVGLYNPVTGERLPAAGTPDGAVKLIEFEVE